MHVSGRVDLAVGLLVALFGAGLAYMAQAGYPLGTLRRMGPGMFPLGLGFALSGLGLALAIAGGLRATAERVAAAAGDARPMRLPGVEWRVALLTLAGVITFALLIQRAGLIPATMAVVAISALADKRNRVLAVLLLAIALCALAVLVFKLALGMSVHLIVWPI